MVRDAPLGVTIRTAQALYSIDPAHARPWISSSSLPTCPGAAVAVAAVLDCPNRVFETYTVPAGAPPGALQRQLATPSITIHPDQHAGRPAIVLVAHQRQQPFPRSGAGPVTETRRLYLAPDTFLPLA